MHDKMRKRQNVTKTARQLYKLNVSADRYRHENPQFITNTNEDTIKPKVTNNDLNKFIKRKVRNRGGQNRSQGM